jgi:hypothetical protein
LAGRGFAIFWRVSELGTWPAANSSICSTLKRRRAGQSRWGSNTGVTFVCEGVNFQLGDYVWDFIPPFEWPPELPDNGMAPYPVPGSLTLTSPTRGVFVADVDGSRMDVKRGEVYRDQFLGGCM